MAQHDDSQDLRAINLRLSAELVERIDQLKGEFGLRSRGAIVERLLSHLFTDPDLDDGNDLLADSPASAVSSAAAAVVPERAVEAAGQPSGQPAPAEQLALEPVEPVDRAASVDHDTAGVNGPATAPAHTDAATAATNNTFFRPFILFS